MQGRPTNVMLHLGPAAGGDRATLVGAVRQANRYPGQDAVVLSPRPKSLIEHARRLGIKAKLRKTVTGHLVVHVPRQHDRWNTL